MVSKKKNKSKKLHITKEEIHDYIASQKNKEFYRLKFKTGKHQSVKYKKWRKRKHKGKMEF